MVCVRKVFRLKFCRHIHFFFSPMRVFCSAHLVVDLATVVIMGLFLRILITNVLIITIIIIIIIIGVCKYS